ncbi:MAG TPA: AAA family ATPase [Terriglobales bacterium]|jgi:predicted ATPase|nr:AAA family ATPase [Terriglobales bacterium]
MATFGIPLRCVLLAGLLLSLEGPSIAGTIGSPLVSGSSVDTAVGFMYAFQGSFNPTDVGKSVQSWGFYNSEPSSHYWVTPLILEQEGEDKWKIVGIGKSRQNSGAGLQRYPFDLKSGTAEIANTKYTFGWWNGKIGGGPNGGVVEYSRVASPIGYAENCEVINCNTPSLSVPQVGQTVVFANHYSGPNRGGYLFTGYGRLYSIEFSTNSTEALTFADVFTNFIRSYRPSLLSALALAVLSALVFGAGLKIEKRLRSLRTTLSSRLEKPEYRDVQAILADRQLSEEERFVKNLGDGFLLRSFELKSVLFFEDCVYEFRPRVNVLLGRNGYGKTLLLRTLAATIQSDLENGGLLFPPDARKLSATQSESDPLVTLRVERNGEPEETVRDRVYFRKTTGRIPLLAIPDLRFMNRQVKVFVPPAIVPEPLSRSGARHFVTQEPYENKVLELLYTLCLDYNESGKSFRPPIFRLLEQVVRELTEDRSFAFHSMNRLPGTTGYEILVTAEGTGNQPMPIQRASQGTLSVLVIFGQIYYFLATLRPKITAEAVFQLPGIVLIDEVDAHLHPFWQQKLMGLLTAQFPNVQFIVSAHSPLIVAGCDRKEVAVLRRTSSADRFRVDVLEQDFLGAQLQDLYKLIFETDDMDRLYLEYSAKVAAGAGPTVVRQIEQLEKMSKRTPDEERQLKELVREDRLLQRAAEVRQTRLENIAVRAHIEKLENELEMLQDELRKRTGALTNDGLS